MCGYQTKEDNTAFDNIVGGQFGCDLENEDEGFHNAETQLL